jgi:hypothetical protein
MSGLAERVSAPSQHDTRLRPTPQSAVSAVGILHSAWTAFTFELARSRTWKRLMIWAAVAFFPGIILMMMRGSGGTLPQAVWVSLIFVFVTEMVVLLNALLWVAPLVQAELEGKTWLYVAVRPFGRFALVLGKGLNGLTWTLAAGLASLCFAITVASVGAAKSDRSGEFGPIDLLTGLIEPVTSGGVLAALTVLSSLAYSSLFSAIGCITPKRAMLVAFSYTLIFEAMISFVPAIINRLTMQYHLRCLLTSWMDFQIPPESRSYLFSDSSPAWHVGCLLVMAVFWQIVALSVIHYRQYVTADEN